MANDLSYNQIATLLSDIVAQATGTAVRAPVNTAEFVSVAQTALKCGYDPMLNSISQVLARTIFSVRPYSSQFQMVQVDNQRYGNHVRKISPIAGELEDDQRYDLTDGQSIDMYNVAKPQVLQTNIYGMETYQKHYTLFKEQLDTAFTGPDQFARYVTMITTESNNLLTQVKETAARALVTNHIGAIKYKETVNPERVVHLLTMYNNLTGLSLTPANVFAPENFTAFAKWMYAAIAEVQRLLTVRSYQYHTLITGKEVARHTPYSLQRVMFTARFMDLIKTSVLSDVYNMSQLTLPKYEAVSIWQSIKDPMNIEVNPITIDSTGALDSTSPTQDIANLVGIIYDWEAMGITWINEWSSVTPLNSAGGYWNWFFHWTGRYWADFTENAVIFLLD